MLVCPLCQIALGAHDAVCPRDGNLGQEASWNVVPAALEKRFTLIAPFAHGLTGSTYLADEPETGRRGVLKVLAPAPRTQTAERQRMRRELLKQATMTASHLALPFATGETDDTLWLFREHIEGTALHAHLSKHGPLPMAQALLISAQLTSALDELHRAGLLHRDLKPAHVILAKDEEGGIRSVLIDSGVCKPLASAGTAVVFGSAGYVAPEQLAGKLVSFRSDLYAIGCVLYEMLTGRAPFARDDIAATLAAQQEGTLPAFPVELSPQVAALVASLLAKDPQDRPFSAQKLRRALDPFLPYGATVNRHPNASLNKPSAANPPADQPLVAPVSASRIPGLPSTPPPRPMGRSSGPPPPPMRRSTADATQQLQVEQIMEMASRPSSAGARPASIAPPPTPQRSAASEAARKRDVTEPFELDSVLEVKDAKGTAYANNDKTLLNDKTVSSDKTIARDKTISNDKTIEKPKPQRPSADLTQPIRLDQILAVANQRKKALSAPPPAVIESVPPAAAVPVMSKVTPAAADAALTTPLSIELEIPEEPAENPLSAVLDQPLAVPPLPVSTLPFTPALSAQAKAQPTAIVYALTHDNEDDDDEPVREAATVVAERPAADKRSAYPTLIGLGTPKLARAPVSGTVARGSEAPPPQHPVETPQDVAIHYGSNDSGQLTLPRDPAAAIEEAGRMEAPERARPKAQPRPRTRSRSDDDSLVLPIGSAQARKIGYAAAAAVLLGLAGFGAVKLFGGDDEKAVAKQDHRAVEPTDTGATAPIPEPEPAARPLAEAPKGEPTPTITRIEVVQPAPAPPVAEEAPKPAIKPKASTTAETKLAASESRSERRERAAKSRESSGEKVGKVDKEALWSKARDEARAHYAAKRYKQAAQAYEQAAKYNPSHAGTFAGLGSARMQAGDYRGAAQAYQRAIQLSPDTSGFHAALGKAYLGAGDKSKGRAAYKRALALDPKNEAAKAALLTL